MNVNFCTKYGYEFEDSSCFQDDVRHGVWRCDSGYCSESLYTKHVFAWSLWFCWPVSESAAFAKTWQQLSGPGWPLPLPQHRPGNICLYIMLRDLLFSLLISSEIAEQVHNDLCNIHILMHRYCNMIVLSRLYLSISLSLWTAVYNKENLERQETNKYGRGTVRHLPKTDESIVQPAG